MFGRKKTPEIPSRIAAGMHVQGDCVFEGVLQVDGTVLGDVVGAAGTQTTLVISESGRIEGAVRASAITIDGAVVGPVTAEGALALQAHAQIQGNVRYQTLAMQPGAVLSGQLQPQLPPAVEEPATEEPTAAEAMPGAVRSSDVSMPKALAEPTLDFNRSLDPR